MNARSSVGIAVLLAMSCHPCCRAKAAEGQTELIPEDACVLQLSLPEGATVNLDGQDYGKQRRLEYNNLQPGRIYTSVLRTRLRDGAENKRELLVRGGWNVAVSPWAGTGSLPELVPQTGHSGACKLAVSSDGRLLLTGGDDGKVILWNTANGRQLRLYGVLTDYLVAVSFTADGRRVTAVDWSGWVTWDITTGRRLRTQQFPDRLDSNYDVCFTAHGQQLLVAGTPSGRTRSLANNNLEWAGEVALWDIDTGNRLRAFDIGWGSSHGLAIAADVEGRVFVVARPRYTSQGTVTIWETHTGTKIQTIPTTGSIQGISLSNSGKLAAICASDQPVKLLDLSTGRVLQQFDVHGHGKRPVALSPDGLLAAVGDGVWDCKTGHQLRKRDVSTQFHHVAFSPDGQKLAGSYYKWTDQNSECAVSLLDVRSERTLGTFEGHSMEPADICLSDDDRYLLIAVGKKAILWDLPAGRIIRDFAADVFFIYAGAFSRDGRQVALGGPVVPSLTSGVDVFDTHTGDRLRSVSTGMNGAHSVAFTSTGSLLAASGWNGWKLYDLGTGAELADFDTSRLPSIACFNNLTRLAATSDKAGGHVLTGCQQDIGAILWDTKNGEPIRVFRSSEDVQLSERVAAAVDLSPDETCLVTGDMGGRVVLWDSSNGKRLREIGRHPGAVSAVRFLGSGRYIVASSADEMVTLFETGSGAKKRSLLTKNSRGKAVVTSDARYAFRVADDGTTVLWDLATGDKVAGLSQISDGQDWLVTTPQGVFDGSEGARKKVGYRIGDGLNVVPVDRFFKDFYRPGLLAAIWRGERPMPEMEVSKSLPPLVKIVSPDSGTTDSQEVSIEIDVGDQGGGITGPWLTQNGARILTPGKVEREGNRGRRLVTVLLVEGENRLEARAATGDGSWDSEPALLVLRYEKPLVKPELHLVAVGINQYAQATLSLKYAAADANAMAELFEKRGPALYGEGKVHVTRLLDDKATKEGIKKALADVAQKARPQDTLVLLLSGHGIMVGQRYYFLPHEFQSKSDDLEESIRQQGLAGDELNDVVAAVPALKRVVIYDTCQSGGAIGPSRMARSPFGFQKALEQMARSQGSFILAATAAGDEAQESQQLGHGVLTYTLLARLGAISSGPLGDRPLPEGDVVKVRDWFGFAQDEVPALSKVLFGREQLIKFTGSGNDFPILPVNDNQADAGPLRQ